MNSSDKRYTAQCGCGHVSYSVTEAPLLRAHCHCTICQEFNRAAYGDIALYHARDVILPAEGTVVFKAWRPPPAVQRGRCTACDQPAVEVLSMPLLPKMIIVPVQTLSETVELPPPSLHVFYHSRVADIDDDVPKYSGYWGSQLAFGRHLIKGMMARP